VRFPGAPGQFQAIDRAGHLYVGEDQIHVVARANDR
jgi:hypothetical protein